MATDCEAFCVTQKERERGWNGEQCIYCSDCDEMRASPSTRSQTFFSPCESGLKKSKHPEQNTTNTRRTTNNINPIRYKVDSGYCSLPWTGKVPTLPSCNTDGPRLNGNLPIATETLSKMTTKFKPILHRNAKQNKISYLNTETRWTGKVKQNCSKDSKSELSKRTSFKETILPAKMMHLSGLYSTLFLTFLGFNLRKNHFMALLFTFLVAASATDAFYTGRRRYTRGQNGARLPRQSGFSHGSMKADSERCERITVPMCEDIGYNYTDMSLSIKYSQSEAKEELKLFTPLVSLNCSHELKLLLCSIYTPICMKGYPKFMPPCRFVCERARTGCLPIMKKYSYTWPDTMRCDQYPKYEVGNTMCMHFNLTKPKSMRRSSTVQPTVSTRRTTTKLPKTSSTTTSRARKIKTTPPTTTKSPATSPIGNTSLSTCECNAPMVTIVDTTDPLYNRVTTGLVLNCAVSCKSPYFTEEQISFAELWIKSWSIVCFIVTLLTVSTFLIDMERFRYPERPIIFLSACYMFVSIGFLIRIIAGHESVACAYGTNHVLYHTTGPVLCTIIFLLVYFFSMASALWWVILSMTWFLAAGLKWGYEAIEKYSQYYHAAAWLIPSLQTIMVLAMSSVDGDSLSGICFVGNQDVRALRGFVLAPLVVYLALGGMFLLAGFISLFRIRNRIKKDGTKTDKLEKLMGRIGIFSVLYMVPAGALVTCYFYEQQNRPLWENWHNCGSTKSVKITPSYKPEFSIFMGRYLMTLLIGITNGVWICSSKTLTSWKGFYRRCICCLHGSPCPPPCGKEIDKSSIYRDPIEGGDGRVSQNSFKGSNQSDRYSDSRHESSHSRSHDRVRPESKASSGRYDDSSRSGRRTGKRRAPCEVCDRCSRSSESADTSERRRQRRHTTRGSVKSDKSGLSQTSRKRPSGSENGNSKGEVLCGNNTTSTDGSDRPLNSSRPPSYCNDVENCSGNVACCSKTRDVYPGQGSSCSSVNRTTPCCQVPPSAYKHRTESGEDIVINRDYLPEYNPHEVAGKSMSSLPVSECDQDVMESLLNSRQYQSTSAPFYRHYHHHHYQDDVH